MAMKGKDCFAIASDLRFGVEYQTISCNVEKIFEFDSGLFLGMAGLVTDSQTVSQKLRYYYNMYRLSHFKEPSPFVFLSMVSSLLYSKRFGPYFIEPIVCGFEGNDVFLSSCDLIGGSEILEDFAVVGTAKNQILGMCECLFEPDMDRDRLFETASQCMLNGLDRDAMSGWGVVLYLVEKGKVTKSVLKSRMD
ncbi:Proteasome subunit beta type-3 [Thelohanellus kitauei]|uniref:Proteasome subunit beta n=1 Tax=Thelohanellus kitauei TaxID=669202 RepID=A0A0C2MJR5_THEKT|nr:Proteasome subunit beta type-3 [Thelohanellus kitauei]